VASRSAARIDVNLKLAVLALFASTICFANSEASNSVSEHAENRELSVRASNFSSSKLTNQDWARKVFGGTDPLGPKNSYFRLRVTDKSRKSSYELPMIPSSFISISPHSEFIAVLSTAFPTAGVVVVSRAGNVVFRDFSLCFSGDYCIASYEDVLPWFFEQDVEVDFSSVLEGDDCLMTIRKNTDEPSTPEITMDVCSHPSSE
jgi:hypothetical protein